MCIEASKWEEAKCLQQISNKYTLSLPLNKVDHSSSNLHFKKYTRTFKKKTDKAYNAIFFGSKRKKSKHGEKQT